MRSSIVREDGVYLANTRFQNMSGEIQYIAVFIFFIRDCMVFHGEPSDVDFSFSSDFVRKILDLKRELAVDILNVTNEPEEYTSKYRIATNGTVIAEFDGGRANQEISLTSGFFGGVSYSLTQKYHFFMDYMNPERSGPRNFEIISNAPLKFHSF
jgi:hypothetical protein